MRTIARIAAIIGSLLLATFLESASTVVTAQDTDCWLGCDAVRTMSFDADYPAIGIMGVINSGYPIINSGEASENIRIMDNNGGSAGGPTPLISINAITMQDWTHPKLAVWGLNCSARNFGPALPQNKVKVLYDSTRNVWDYWINGVWGSCPSPDSAQTYGDAIWVGDYVFEDDALPPEDRNVIGNTVFSNMRYKREPSGCGSSQYPCTGWWIPDDSTAFILHGPPPVPRLYWTLWGLNQQQYMFAVFTDCLMTDTC